MLAAGAQFLFGLDALGLFAEQGLEIAALSVGGSDELHAAFTDGVAAIALTEFQAEGFGLATGEVPLQQLREVAFVG